MALLSSVMFLQNSHVKTAFYPPSCIKPFLNNLIFRKIITEIIERIGGQKHVQT